MRYKYQRTQIFRKKLDLPKDILFKVYNCTLLFSEFIEYKLDDKIPITCLDVRDRQIVEKFGLEKAKQLDWELLDYGIYNGENDLKKIIMSFDENIQNLNETLYEMIKNQMKPSDYSSSMKEFYKDRILPILEGDSDDLRSQKWKFNHGELSLKELIFNWDLYKDKDLSYCLIRDRNNEFGISDNQLKQFMGEFDSIAELILLKTNIYTFISEINDSKSEFERKKVIKKVTDSILDTIDQEFNNSSLTNEQYSQLFKYSSIEEYLKKNSDEMVTNKILSELKYLNLSEFHLLDISIPFSILKNRNVLSFLSEYGLKNVIEFDDECGHFFTKNNYEMLKNMYSLYLHYATNNPDTRTSIITKGIYSENNLGSYKPYTKDEFYEAIRRMIVYGPSDSTFADKCPDYRDITGAFRIKNPELFISDQSPEELKKAFYTKSITPQLLVKHPEYIHFLSGKDLSSCFKDRKIQVVDNNALYRYENIYKFIGNKTDFSGLMNFITEYSDVLDIVFDIRMPYHDQYEIKFSNNDDINQIQNKIHETLRKLIIEKGLTYPTHIPKELISKYPSMFLDKTAPQELQEAFYGRTITSEFILSNPTYRNHLNGVDLECLFKYMPVGIMSKNYLGDIAYTGSLEHKRIQENINFVNALKETFGESNVLDVMLIYGKYVEQVYEANNLKNFLYNLEFTQDEFLDELDKTILQNIIDLNMKYDENISSHFKNNNPTLFLGADVPQEIKDKFYNREFTLKDFNDNPELLNIFENTNIACAFSENMSWIIPLFNDTKNFKTGNYNRMKVILAYSKIQDVDLQKTFKEYVMKFETNIDVEKIEYVSEVLSRLSLSNSSEIFTFRKELAPQILKSDNPFETFDKIESLFVKNNIPTVGKIYSCFDILHPDFKGFNFDNSMISPVLKSSTLMGKSIVIFSDLIKCSFGSNNRSVNDYLNNIDFASKLYESIRKGQIQYDELDQVEKDELLIFSRHLATLYNNTLQAKKMVEEVKLTGSVMDDLLELSKKMSPNGTLNYNLGDRVIRMFCGFAGINTLSQAKEYIYKKITTVDEKNRNAAGYDMILERGDFIKGIGSVNYLKDILQNGSISKEYLGASAGSDFTPLDTDVSMIITNDRTISDKINSTAANSYGPIWFVLKNDDRFMVTRDSNRTFDAKKDMTKMEVFYTGVVGKDHYGIRTGFASSEINYVVMEDYDSRVGLEIAMNGFYIPVADKNGKIIFTPNDYDKLREKMSGLSYYGENNYVFSNNLITEDTQYFADQVEKYGYEIHEKREKITAVIKKSLGELDLQLKTYMDGDLTEGIVELIDTGSTGRGTNKLGDGDFDFMMRLDKSILSDSCKVEQLKKKMLKNFGKDGSSELTADGDFRLKNVEIDAETIVDIDITFDKKTDKVSYSTDMALQDRLSTIKKIDPKKYKYVVANILLAKEVLKQAGVYKPNRGETPQGGLGGVGIENWILQNGGSFVDAAIDFIKMSVGKNFSEFKDSYYIWDFGENHLASRRGKYPHDNFVSSNMSEDGYNKMVQVLNTYINNVKLIDYNGVHK